MNVINYFITTAVHCMRYSASLCWLIAIFLFYSISRVDQFGLLTLDGNATYRSNVSGFHRALNVAPPLFIGGVPGTVSLAPQALTVQGELGARLHGLHQ